MKKGVRVRKNNILEWVELTRGEIIARPLPFSSPAGVTVDTQNLEMHYSVRKGPRENKQVEPVQTQLFCNDKNTQNVLPKFCPGAKVCWLHHLFHFLFWYHHSSVLFLMVSFFWMLRFNCGLNLCSFLSPGDWYLQPCGWNMCTFTVSIGSYACPSVEGLGMELGGEERFL